MFSHGWVRPKIEIVRQESSCSLKLWLTGSIFSIVLKNWPSQSNNGKRWWRSFRAQHFWSTTSFHCTSIAQQSLRMAFLSKNLSTSQDRRLHYSWGTAHFIAASFTIRSGPEPTFPQCERRATRWRNFKDLLSRFHSCAAKGLPSRCVADRQSTWFREGLFPPHSYCVRCTTSVLLVSSTDQFTCK